MKSNEIKKYKKPKQYKMQQQKRYFGQSILVRPKNVLKRIDLGHFEADLVIGKRTDKYCLVTVVERASDYSFFLKVERNADSVNKAILLIRQKVLALGSPFLTITSDNGSEFIKLYEVQFDEAGNKLFNAYYARAFRSNDRPINEHINGELRRYFPKGESIDQYDFDYVRKCQRYLNLMPRRKFN